MKNSITIYYNDLQVNVDKTMSRSYSKSPLKPLLYMEKLRKTDIEINEVSDFAPFNAADFHLAHTKKYVKSMLTGKGDLKNSNGVPWSAKLADSVRYTSSSLYHAIKHSILNPDELCVSPTSGFHHARPDGGSGFCTFSGQVIASLKLWDEIGMVGAYFDLDGHFGNSIEDSKRFVKEQHGINLNDVIKYNINPIGNGMHYINDFMMWLDRVKQDLLADRVHYVVWCHGADSHEWDQLGHQCSTEQWFGCSELFYAMIAEVEDITGRQVPVTLALFGGYRDDNYDSVLDLHIGDLAIGQHILIGKKSTFKPVVVQPERRKYDNWEVTRSKSKRKVKN